MGKRGPKVGFKTARKLAEVAKAAPPAIKQEPELTAHDKINPAKLSGQALKDLGYRMGMARSLMEGQSDDRIRMSLRYITYDRYEQQDAA